MATVSRSRLDCNSLHSLLCADLQQQTGVQQNVYAQPLACSFDATGLGLHLNGRFQALAPCSELRGVNIGCRALV